MHAFRQNTDTLGLSMKGTITGKDERNPVAPRSRPLPNVKHFHLDVQYLKNVVFLFYCTIPTCVCKIFVYNKLMCVHQSA
jgi:hypothetical protein